MTDSLQQSLNGISMLKELVDPSSRDYVGILPAIKIQAAIDVLKTSEISDNACAEHGPKGFHSGCAWCMAPPVVIPQPTKPVISEDEREAMKRLVSAAHSFLANASLGHATVNYQKAEDNLIAALNEVKV